MLFVLIIAAIGAIAVLGAEAWVLVHCRNQQRRIAGRLDALAARPAPTPPVPAPEAAAGEERPPAPAFALTSLSGEQVTRETLLAARRPAVLVVTDDTRDPHRELLPDLARWQRLAGDQLTVALATSGAPDALHALARDYGLAAERVLRADDAFARTFALDQASERPTAIRLWPDGTIDRHLIQRLFPIRRELDAMVDRIVAARPQAEPAAGTVGAVAPRFRRPGVAGGTVDLADADERGTILLFLNPGCRHSGQLLPAVKDWADHTGGPRLLVVSRGPADLTQDPGIIAPVVRDDDRSLERRFGVSATPTAVVIDGAGRIASAPYQGALAVSVLATRAWGAPAAAVGAA